MFSDSNNFPPMTFTSEGSSDLSLQSRSFQLVAMVTPDEYKLIDAMAERLDVSRSSFAYSLIRAATKQFTEFELDPRVFTKRRTVRGLKGNENDTDKGA